MRCKRGVHDYPETPSVSVEAACYTYGYQIFECKCCHKKTVENIVEIMDGQVKVSFYFSDTKEYFAYPHGMDACAGAIAELKRLAGDDSVVLK